MKVQVRRGINLSRKFWLNPNAKISFLSQIKNYSDNINAIYQESITKFPNNLSLHEHYADFLIECATDFKNDLKIKGMINLLENGTSFVVDTSFRSLVKSFPAYLRKHILDVKGKFIFETSLEKGSRSPAKIPTGNSSEGEKDELDAESENQLGKSSFSNPRVRLAFQRFFEGKRAMNSVYLKYGLIFALIIGIGVLLFVSLYFYFHFDNRIDDITKFTPLQEFVDSFLMPMDMIMLRIFNLSNEFSTSVFSRISADNGFIKDNEISAVNLSRDFIETSHQSIEDSVNSLGQLMDKIISQSIHGINVHEQYPSITKQGIAAVFCQDNVSYADSPEYLALYHSAVYTLSQMKFLIHKPDIQLLEQKTQYCEMFHSYLPILTGFDGIYVELLNADSDQFAKSEKSILRTTLIVLIVYLVITLPSLIVLSVFAYRELSNLLALMQSIDLESRIEASSYNITIYSRNSVLLSFLC
jgi:hypothetical protein